MTNAIMSGELRKRRALQSWRRALLLSFNKELYRGTSDSMLEPPPRRLPRLPLGENQVA